MSASVKSSLINPMKAAAGLAALREAALDRSSVIGRGRRGDTPHSFYRYPGRFSPRFAASAIQLVSDQGQLVLDPFAGSGTTVLEAIRHRRRAIGVDISPIAHFVARTVARPHSTRDLDMVEAWVGRQLDQLQSGRLDPRLSESFPIANLDLRRNWRLAALLDQLVSRLDQLTSAQSDLVRLALLSASQLAFDHRRMAPSQRDFIQRIRMTANAVTSTLGNFKSLIREEWGPGYSKADHQLLLGPADVQIDRWLRRTGRRADSMVTSPPYAGVHMLYGRWQTDGRRESDLPSWIVGSRRHLREGDFTMFARRGAENSVYFETLGRTMAAARAGMRDGGWAIHMVGFSEPERQLSRYLHVMQAAGFTEKRSVRLATDSDGRLWRSVPGRKWYTGETATQREVVLLFRAT